MESEQRFDHLREHSIGFAQVLFQSITHMAPAAAVVFSLLVGFGFLSVLSLPPYPVRLGNYFAIIWIVLGFVALGLAASRRPQAIARAEEIFVEDETAEPEIGSTGR